MTEMALWEDDRGSGSSVYNGPWRISQAQRVNWVNLAIKWPFFSLRTTDLSDLEGASEFIIAERVYIAFFAFRTAEP